MKLLIVLNDIIKCDECDRQFNSRKLYEMHTTYPHGIGHEVAHFVPK